MSVILNTRSDIVEILKRAGVKISPADIVFPPNPEMGDLALPLFSLAKERGVAPGTFGQELTTKLKPAGLIEQIKSAGPYLNFILNRQQVVAAGLQPARRKERKLKFTPTNTSLKNQRIMLEMVSPNNNKPLHLGHLRNAFLGESVARLLGSQGAKVIRSCLFSDRGLAIAKAMLAYQLWGDGKTPVTECKTSDQFVVQWYVLFEQKSKEDPLLNSKAEELVQKWESGDKETIALWKKMSGWANKGIMASMKRLGLIFDTIYFESKLWKQGKKVVQEGLKKGIFQKGEGGAVIVEFPDLPPKVLLRSDGTAIYATSDLALTSEKFKKYKLARSIWCVGQEQDLYLKQLFAIYKKLAFKWADKCEHLSYGLVHLPEGRMKTREGTVVDADPLLDQIVSLVKEEIKTRNADLTEREIENRAEIIAQAAVRYYLLKVGPTTTVQFDPKASISFTGDTGPYLLYTYARIASILRKAQSSALPPLNPPADGGVVTITNSEWSLVIGLAHFPEIITQAAQERDPSRLAKYLFELAQQFSAFYENTPVLKAEEPARAFRLALIKTFQNTLKEGLHLLTIETVEEM